MDDDGNVLSTTVSNKNIENGRKDKKDEQQKKQTSLVKPNKPPGGNSGRAIPTKPALEPRKLNKDHEMKLQQKSDNSKIQPRPVPTQQNKLKIAYEETEHVKLEATKRKLQERYQEAENAKRQRAIQVMKQRPGVRHSHMRRDKRKRPFINRRQ